MIWFGAAGITSATNTNAAGMGYIINRVEFDDDTPTDVSNLVIYATDMDGGDATVKVAAVADFYIAGFRKEFLASVEQQGSFSGDASGSPSLDGGIMFRPKSLIQPRQVILFDEAGSGW